MNQFYCPTCKEQYHTSEVQPDGKLLYRCGSPTQCNWAGDQAAYDAACKSTITRQLTAEQAAHAIGVTKGQLTHWVRLGALECGRFGRAFIFDEDIIQRFAAFRRERLGERGWRMSKQDLADWMALR